MLKAHPSPQPSPQRGEGVRIAPLFLLLAVLLAACQAPAPSPAEKLPKISDLVRSPVPEAATQPAAGAPLRRVVALCVDLPSDSDLTAAWALPTTAGLARDQVAAWRDNGLRVGVLEAGQFELFMKALPGTVSTQTRQLLTAEDPRALVGSAPLRRAVRVQLPDGPERGHLAVTGGRVQLLARVSEPRPGWTLLMLTPHHHLVRDSVLVRPPEEKALDGRIFTELTLAAPMRAGRWLVLGLEPMAPAATGPASATTQSAQTQPAATQPDPLRNRRRLGDVILGGPTTRKPVQRVVIVSIPDLATGDSPAKPR